VAVHRADRRGRRAARAPSLTRAGLTGPQALGGALIVLLLVDAALAWLAIQATFVLFEILWRAVAGRENWLPLVEAHAHQFTRLRTVEAVAWLATTAIFVWWVRRLRTRLMRAEPHGDGGPTLRPWQWLAQPWRAAVPGAAASRTPPLLAWWWALLGGVVGVEAWALVRYVVTGTPFELGRGLMLVLVASALEIALAVVTLFLVVAIQRGFAPPSAASRPR
jgi:hypothetical protein